MHLYPLVKYSINSIENECLNQENEKKAINNLFNIYYYLCLKVLIYDQENFIKNFIIKNFIIKNFIIKNLIIKNFINKNFICFSRKKLLSRAKSFNYQQKRLPWLTCLRTIKRNPAYSHQWPPPGGL